MCLDLSGLRAACDIRVVGNAPSGLMPWKVCERFCESKSSLKSAGKGSAKSLRNILRKLLNNICWVHIFEGSVWSAWSVSTDFWQVAESCVRERFAEGNYRQCHFLYPMAHREGAGLQTGNAQLQQRSIASACLQGARVVRLDMNFPCAETRGDMRSNTSKHAHQHEQTCTATLANMHSNMSKHAQQHEQTCAATLANIRNNTGKHAQQHKQTFATTVAKMCNSTSKDG